MQRGRRRAGRRLSNAEGAVGRLAGLEVASRRLVVVLYSYYGRLGRSMGPVVVVLSGRR